MWLRETTGQIAKSLNSQQAPIETRFSFSTCRSRSTEHWPTRPKQSMSSYQTPFPHDNKETTSKQFCRKQAAVTLLEPQDAQFENNIMQTIGHSFSDQPMCIHCLYLRFETRFFEPRFPHAPSYSCICNDSSSHPTHHLSLAQIAMFLKNAQISHLSVHAHSNILQKSSQFNSKFVCAIDTSKQSQKGRKLFF